MELLSAFANAIQYILMYIFIVPFFLLLIIFSELIPPTIDTDISNYENYRQELAYAEDFLPDLIALDNASSIEFAYQITDDVFSVPRTVAVITYYTEEAYAAEVAFFEASYDFLDEPIVDTDGDYLLDDAFSYRGFDFRSVATSPNKSDACSYFGLFAANDEQNCIVWLYYDDIDRDYIATPDEDLDANMIGIVEEYFNFESIFE